MPKPWIIVISILGSLAAVYFLFFIVVLILISSFNKKLQKRIIALHLIFKQRQDVTLNIIQVAKKNKVVFSDNLLKEVKHFAKLDEKEINNDSLLGNFARLEKLSLDVNQVLKADNNFHKKEEFLLFQQEILEFDELKRQHISIYNHDVEGYNYWVRFLAYRYLFNLFKVECKKRLE